MKPELSIFFVSSSEYPKLQAACPGDFPFTYEQFVERVNTGTREMSDVATVIKTNICVSEFLAWCDKSKIKPNGDARVRYATLVHAQTIDPIAHF